MKAYTHGGDILTAKMGFQGEIVDFSANLNPLGMPESVRRAAAAAVKGAVHYPDPLCRVLTEGIARRDGVEREWVLCGNGAADLIFRLAFALRPKRALVTAPTFSEYQEAMEAAGSEVVYHRLTPDNDFNLTDAVLEDLDGRLEMAFFCTPNNPTGQPIARGLMERILERCAGRGIRLVVDECFLALSDSGDSGGLAGYVKSYPNLLLLRAFTKCYAMPGLRLGYCITSDTGLLDRLSRCAQPWSVSAPAQAAGVAALQEPLHPLLARQLIEVERRWLTGELAGLGLRVFPSAANYLLFQRAGVTDLRERLLKRGILIRSCANYVGLTEDYYRIAIRLRGENERLVRALKEVL
ncbi:pyridoxal phosphate-dependent aminotransferase [Intestinimonas butyriciproducens]|uniref:L-threonine O-3-phosphate decarboxylase n=1 Tax=Intestinimonas butyriciproducens TaxID=1297617 RepID=A0A2U1CEJ0_9FIRM|nr:aminotransferase class I/II-fold pyridoxal phosphate-dependent enzyme [Intestinimonas butyriciproducens]MBU5229218.1 aminotransferase class I/II-fold pyridoxal phosphate-dependent enzyme [Intestinimonas butyriciproducens]MCI6362180.1 aminotransferase class I/II-fold pyridoxal phosphate-dependent enzyme [Intestinimonas butyriciproducens]MCR1905452.1 aminotransferase class I/II-fold pyridoxal phosphate-dependent enzyme [Intestinimonas butyriciproducens]MDB7829739.1 aminotransferase class I/II-